MAGMLEGYAGIVTGGARGIGRAIALELGRHGAKVAVGYSTQAEAAEEVARQIGESGGEAFPLRGNVAQPGEVKAAVEQVVERFGSINYLVNNAGITRDRTLVRMTQDEWEAVIDVNLHSIFNVTSEVLPYMLDKGYGRVVNVSSVVGQMGNFGQANYATAKAGMIGFTKSVAREVARHGITVNAVCPGPADTPMTHAIRQSEMGEKMFQKLQAATPLKRLVKPDEVAGAVEYFLSDAAAFVTGQVLSLSGGLTMSG